MSLTFARVLVQDYFRPSVTFLRCGFAALFAEELCFSVGCKNDLEAVPPLAADSREVKSE